MSSELRLELDSAGIAQFLRSAELSAELMRRAQAVANAAGPGMRAEVYQGTKDRTRARVYTDTFAAKRAEAVSRSLTKAIDAARG